MSARTHFYLSPEPVDFSVDLPRSALCGAVIARPRLEFTWNLTERGLPEFNSCRDCRSCIHEAEFGDRPHDAQARYYLYGIVEGEEAQERPA